MSNKNTVIISNCQTISIDKIIISDSTTKLYDYSDRESEITSIMESISEIGQQQPILVIADASSSKHITIDGVLRLMAMNRLNLNEVNAIISDFIPTNDFSLADFIIHNQIKKQKTDSEKINEIRALLRIDCDDTNPLRDKESRVRLVSALLGTKGWGRNNVFNLEKVLRWEKKSDLGLDIANKMVSNEVAPSRALEAIQIIENNDIDKKKEAESHVVKEFLKGSYDKNHAKNLIGNYDQKKKESGTNMLLYPVRSENYQIIQGNNDDIVLPSDLEIDTIFTSPPYYRIVRYGTDPNELGWEKTPEEYIIRLADILMKGYNQLKPTGSMFVNLGETYIDSECLAIPYRLVMELKSRGVFFVDTIVWDKVNAKPMGNNVKRLLPGYELILHFSVSKNYYFDRIKLLNEDKDLTVTRGCHEKGSDSVSFHISNNYDQFRTLIEENSIERIPGSYGITNVITLQQNSARTKHIEGEAYHPATFSSKLPLIPLLMSCPKTRESVVFDPFMGSASCGITALLLGFKFVGVELYEKNIVTAKRLLNSIETEFDEIALKKLAQIDRIIDPEDFEANYKELVFNDDQSFNTHFPIQNDSVNNFQHAVLNN